MSALRISTDKSELDVDMIHAFLRDQTPWARGMPGHAGARGRLALLRRLRTDARWPSRGW